MGKAYLWILIFGLITTTSFLSAEDDKDKVLLDFYSVFFTRDLGYINYGDSVIIDYTIGQSSNTRVIITDVRFKNTSNNSFIYIPRFSTPDTLLPGETPIFCVKFKPVFLGEYVDTLVISWLMGNTITQPTEVEFKGTSVINDSIWLKDTLGIIGNNQFKLPVYCKSNSTPPPIENIAYHMTISIENDMLYPTGITQGTIIDNYVLGPRRYITIVDTNVRLSSVEKPLTELICTVLNGEKRTSAMKIESFEWNEQWVITNRENGIFSSNETCQSEATKFLLPYIPTKINVCPNPMNSFGYFIITSEEEGDFDMRISNLNGIVVDKFVWQATKKDFPYQRLVDFTNFANGTYIVTLKSPTVVVSKQIQINK